MIRGTGSHGSGVLGDFVDLDTLHVGTLPDNL